MRLFNLCDGCLKRDNCFRNKSNVKNTCKLYEQDTEVIKARAKVLQKLNNTFKPMLDTIEDAECND